MYLKFSGLYKKQDYYAVKIPVFSDAKLTDVDVAVGPEMKSTGEDGGFELLKRPEHIMLFDVMEATETTMKINRCLEDDNHCNRQAAALCRIRCFYVDLQELIDTKLKKTTIRDLLLT